MLDIIQSDRKCLVLKCILKNASRSIDRPTAPQVPYFISQFHITFWEPIPVIRNRNNRFFHNQVIFLSSSDFTTHPSIVQMVARESGQCHATQCYTFYFC